jgi:hypothetical protein
MNVRRMLSTVAVTGGVFLSGCADWDTYNNKVGIGSERTHEVFVDAKQRAVITVPATATTYTYDGKGVAKTRVDTVLRVCAEPSPDALSALALSASGSADVQGKANVMAGISAAESAASIGLRTQSIQLMRDAGYRLCEAAASGLLSSFQFETLERRYQSAMVAILAIEQLTGTVKAQQVSLANSGAITTNADAVVKLTATLTDAKKTLSDDQAAATSAQTQAATDAKAVSDFLMNRSPSDLMGDDLTSYNTKNTTATASATTAKKAAAQVTTDQAAVDDTQKSLDTARAASLTAGGTAAFGTGSSSNAAQTADIASAVKGIVSETLEMGFLRETCATLMTAALDGRSAIEVTDVARASDGKPGLSTSNDALAVQCRDYFAATVETYRSYSLARQAAAKYVDAQQTDKMPIDGTILKILLDQGADSPGAPASNGAGSGAGDGGAAAALKVVQNTQAQAAAALKATQASQAAAALSAKTAATLAAKANAAVKAAPPKAAEK